MRRRYRQASSKDLHRDWLELVDADGPFLSIPVLGRAWPQGMPTLDSDRLALLRDAKPAFEKAWDNWDRHRDDPSAVDTYREARDSWVETVLRDVLAWGDHYDTDATGLIAARSPNHAVTVTPTGALTHDGRPGALVLVVDPVDSLRDALADGWAASPIDRMEELLRASGVLVGVVTDGRWWALVSARPETMLASGVVDAQEWIAWPQVRNAFCELLRPLRLIGGDPADRLTELFASSVAAAEQITEALGVQVRRAVELLVQALSEASLEARHSDRPDPLPADRSRVYDAAVTVMMRVVFLLFAEERGLLPASDLFATGYGIRGELDELDQRMREDGGETLDATYLTWHRLLATCQALYRGASFEDLRLPSYGGSLFDPDRYPFLTARAERGTLAVAVSDRVMVEVLRSVQMAELKGEPARRISFRDIDVEQIGYIYEGLLGYTTRRADQVIVGLVGKSGEEPEIPLAELERLTAAHRQSATLAKAIIDWAKADQPACKPPTPAALAKALKATVEDADRALRAVTTDEALRDRLRPYVGIIRRDLRGRPHVIQPGGVLVVETPSRATAGAHYTPKNLAEEVVHYALEPLVFDPGPHQSADRDDWRPVSSDRILDLKIADIACGSGAFLVAAARYLADRLVEAWHREGVATGSAHDLHTQAVRKIVATCLYGADINSMAVEMGKLSLWLVSLDPHLPFSFVDDKVLHGNSLLGLTDARQLKELHIDPDAVDGQMSIEFADVDGVLAKATQLRRTLATEVDDADPQRSATTKRRQWREYQQLTAQLTDVADAVIAAGLRLGGKPGRALTEAYQNLRIAVSLAYPGDGTLGDRTMLDGILRAGLTPTVPTDYDRWKPLHWILAVPDVMERGGFDAVVGNPPFLGGKKISPVVGTDVREWFVNVTARGRTGNADEVAYFFLRAFEVIAPSGKLGLIGTNSLGQGDTREVGLGQMVDNGFTIARCIQSMRWPTSGASLEVAICWGTRGLVQADVPRVADGAPVGKISTLLEPVGRVSNEPVQLAENLRIAFQGCIVLGTGFLVEPGEAAAWIAADSGNKDVLFPYLNGDDLNSHPDSSPSRWVIDFGERTLNEAMRYELPWHRVQQGVRPVRSKKDAKKYPRMVDEWWKFWNPRPTMRNAIAGLKEFLAMTRHSVAVMPVRVPSGPVPSEAIEVFATEKFSDQAVLSSSVHQSWAICYGSSLGTGPRYTAKGVFRPFPRPQECEATEKIGELLEMDRKAIMLTRSLGLTALYNLINDPDVADSADKDIARMRQIHVELDDAVMAAYGWSDVPLNHGFHTYRRMTRWTVDAAARVEIFDRLLELNHERASAQGDAPPAPEVDDADEDDE